MAERDLFTIVVVGAMNPAIHHPYWYRNQGLISDEELQTALKSAEAIFIPHIAQFNTGEIEINCQSGRWEVKAIDRSRAGRIAEIAARLFDTVLPHTPVTSCGFNFILLRSVRANAPALLAGLASGAIDFNDPLETAEFVAKWPRNGNRVLSLVLSPDSDRSLRFKFNVHYSFPGEIGSSPFNLKPTLDELPDRLADAERIAERILHKVDHANGQHFHRSD